MEAEVWHIDEYRQALEDEKNCTPFEMARHFDNILGRMRVVSEWRNMLLVILAFAPIAKTGLHIITK